jgi:endonuclease/exonuclease/phosphatase family metal-dependent hydrolase
MTWNVENLFRPGGMAGVTDPPLYEQKLENLASMISTHRPDVIGLQEVGDPAALDDLKAILGASYPHVLVATHFDAMHPIRVAALLRRGIKPVGQEELVDFPAGALSDVPQETGPLTEMGRGELAFSATIGGESVRFVVAHLKSKLLTYPGGRFQPRDENEHEGRHYSCRASGGRSVVLVD